MSHVEGIPAEEALRRLKEGNSRYTSSSGYSGDISPQKRTFLAENGQHPYAAVVTCSDSRVVPEIIFDAGFRHLYHRTAS